MQTEFNKKGGGRQELPSDIVIFLDIDGVLADFEPHMHAHGKASEKGTPVWDALDPEWWASMPVIRGAKNFYYELKKLAPVKFLSAPVPGVDSFTGKARWLIEGFLPERKKYATLDLMLVSAKNKHLLAAPGRILVDDRQKNVDEWIAAGGIGIHHKGDFTETMAAVKQAIDTFRQSAPAAQVTPPQP